MPEVIPLSDREGQSLLKATPVEAINWRALECSVPQANPCYCGPAAIVTALSMRLASDKCAAFVSQETLFDGEVRHFLTRAQMLGRAQREWTDGDKRIPITYAGLSVEEAARILRVYLTRATVRYAQDQDLGEFCHWLAAAPRTPAIVNFSGAHLKLPLAGHFAVIGAFCASHGYALVLDPARHKLGWYWAGDTALFAAMQCKRPHLNRSRGWIELT